MHQPSDHRFAPAILRTLAASLVAAFGHAPGLAHAQTGALPAGAQVVNGSAQIVTQGGQMNIATSRNAVLDWQSFSIGAGNGVHFQQPDAASKVLNRVVGNDASSILGSLSSNGAVWLVNPHGVLFGAGARIDVGALVASSLGITNDDFLAGRHRFGADGVVGRDVVNGATVATSFGGHVWLVGSSVRNDGAITAPGGHIVLAAGRSIDLVDSGMPNVTVRVSAPDDRAVNLGTLLAPQGGSIDLHGAMVNQNGIVRADSVGADAAGRVILRATQQDVHLERGGQTSADGDGAASGGQVLVESVNGTSVVLGGLSAASASQTGGKIQVLGRVVKIDAVVESDEAAAFKPGIDASGERGGGEVLIGGAARGADPGVREAGNTWLGTSNAVHADARDVGNGGRIVVRSSGLTEVHGELKASGGEFGGAGGEIETSGHVLDARPASVFVRGIHGDGGGGTWLLGAGSLRVADGESDAGEPRRLAGRAAGAESIVAGRTIGRVLADGSAVRLVGGGQGPLPQDGNIVIDATVTSGGDRQDSFLSLEAHNDIVFAPGSAFRAASTNTRVVLTADANADGAGAIRMGEQSSILTGGSSLQLRAPQIALQRSLLGAGAIDIAGDAVTLDRSILLSNSTIRIDGAASLALADSSLSAHAPGDAIVLGTGRFDARGSSLATPEGRWLVYLDRIDAAFQPAQFDALGYTFVQVGVGADGALPGYGIGAHGVVVRDGLDVQVKVDADRSYDGTTRALFSRALANNLDARFTLQGGAYPVEGAFADRHAGSGKRIDYAGGQLFALYTATGQPVYGARQTYVADIAPRAIGSGGIAALDKVYDGARQAALSGALAGILAGDDVALGGASALFDDRNAGAGKAVQVTGAWLAGADAGNYLLDSVFAVRAAIAPRRLDAGAVTAQDKVYDGSRAATVSATLAGIVAGDSVRIDGITGLFDDRNAGQDKTVLLSGARLAGADAANYTFAAPATTRASILHRPLEIVIAGAVAREYDATTGAALAADAFALANVVAGDNLAVRGPAVGSFDSRDAGSGKRVVASGLFEILGADAANYRVGAFDLAGPANRVEATAAGNVGTITPATLVYRANPAAFAGAVPPAGLDGTVTGFKGGDTLASATSGALQWHSTVTPASGPGAHPIFGSGLSAANYVLVQDPGNATALAWQPGLAPGGPQQRAQDDSTQAVASALAPVLPALQAVAASGALLDRTGPAAARTFAAVQVSAMNHEELARMLVQRRDFKRKLFADAVYKLAIDPSLADVRPCASAADAGAGACRVTAAQLALMHATAAQATGEATVQPKPVALHASVPQIERKIALLIGINDYGDKTIPQLDNAIPDADAMGRLFADKLGYEVRIARNAGKAEIVRLLNTLATEAGSADSVVVYYAGHGYSLEQNGAGYWLPADARATDPKGWISNNDIARFLAGIRARQMTLISDSCYSGAFAREGLAAVGKNVSVDDVLAKRSVVVLSSGGDEPVADEGKGGHSIFAWNLMQVVGKVRDWKPGSTVFADVQAQVKREFPQTPRYGSLTAAGHQAGGDYLFESRSN